MRVRIVGLSLLAALLCLGASLDTSKQPSEGYAFLWEAYPNQYRPKVQVVARRITRPGSARR